MFRHYHAYHGAQPLSPFPPCATNHMSCHRLSIFRPLTVITITWTTNVPFTAIHLGNLFYTSNAAIACRPMRARHRRERPHVARAFPQSPVEASCGLHASTIPGKGPPRPFTPESAPVGPSPLGEDPCGSCGSAAVGRGLVGPCACANHGSTTAKRVLARPLCVRPSRIHHCREGLA